MTRKHLTEEMILQIAKNDLADAENFAGIEAYVAYLLNRLYWIDEETRMDLDEVGFYRGFFKEEATA